MPIYNYKSISPSFGEDCFIAPSADIIGKVVCGDNVSIWFQAIVRGDVDSIAIGDDTNIQDHSMLHITEGIPLVIGSGVTVGHSCTLHSCTIEDNCLIGMGATILDNAVIGKNSLVAAGSLVPPGKKFPEGSFIVGSPAILKRKLTDEELKNYGNHYKSYLKTKDEYLEFMENTFLKDQ